MLGWPLSDFVNTVDGALVSALKERVTSVAMFKRVQGVAWRQLRGRLRWQPQFERLLPLALAGMNVGSGADVEQSGERSLFTVGSLRAVRDPVVFDVGANRGDWTKLVIRELGPRCRIFAFEPSKAAYQNLVANTRSHEAVKCFNVALDSHPGKRTLYSDTPGSGLGSVYPRRLVHLGLHLGSQETIRVTTLDQAVIDESLDHIDLLKLDVEGNELAVLSGAKEMLAARAIRVIQWEFGGCNIDSRTFFQDFWYLLSSTHDVFRLVRDGVWPIRTYRETLEQFVTTNYVAVLRGDLGSRCAVNG